MCGIAGIIGENPNNSFILTEMLKVQHHRGPDATGIWIDENVYLGHNRLSIIDLTESANQPMVSECGRYVIVFNGEIYNYKELKSTLNYNFKTQSDTEVILALFQKKGANMLNDLNGMFVIAIWDSENKSLFLARDRFGVKPLYYSFFQNQFYFASEIKTLWKSGIPKEKKMSVWVNYINSGSYGMPDECFWNTISQFKAGHYAVLKQDDISLNSKKWYQFETNIKNTPILSKQDLKNQYLELLEQSLTLRFRADVPVGFNISGGLDSSTLLALVDKLNPINNFIEAFTFYCNDERYDELPWVEKLISQTNKPLNPCLLSSENVEKILQKVAYFQDEPFGGFPTLAYSQIFKKAREKGVIVLLDGQGMDEAWAGYDYYLNKSGFTIQGTKTSPTRPEVLNEELNEFIYKDIYEKPFDDELKNLQYRDLFYTKIPRTLRFNDRVSMMHSTELREPFLDYRLVELAFAQPENMKIQNGTSKWMLRELVGDLLHKDIAFAPKRPLQTPQREWIANELKDFFNDKISEFSKLDFINEKQVLNIWNDYQNGNQDNSFYLWQWINLNEILK